MTEQDMQLFSRFNKQVRFLLRVIDIFCIYAWVVSLKDNKNIITADAFQKTFNESGCKRNKKLVDKRRKVFNESLK